MIKRKNIFIILEIILLIVILAISSYFFFKQVLENRNLDKEYEEIQDIVTTEVIEKNTDDKENTYEKIDLKDLYKINSDLVGWIKIDDTNINYPVMQNEDFYLRRNIYKDYSSYGTPYLAKYCDIKTSDNLVIYGHHMNNSAMFGELENYKNKSFYDSHKYIKFYTLENDITTEHIYEIITVFKTVVYSENSFKYYSFNNAKDSQDFDDYVSMCKQLQLYETGKTANYRDKLITLSTCEYSRKNGRMVVVAKEV